jgi:uncharacterized protein YkwD
MAPKRPTWPYVARGGCRQLQGENDPSPKEHVVPPLSELPAARYATARVGRGGARRVSAALTVLALTTGSVLAAGTVIAPPASAATPAAESDFVARINAERAAIGVRPLGVATDLTIEARGWSDRMAADNRLYHNADYQYQVGSWQALAENVGTGGSVASLDAAFYNSPDHRTNLLNGDYREVGLGVTVTVAGVMWVTADFRQPNSPPTGGAIGALYDALGGVGSVLGRPTTGEFDVGQGGRAQGFEGGSAYWSTASGAAEVHGAIRDDWATYGWEQGFLGYPVTNELATPDGAGRFNHFQGGSVYWSPGTGAHEVHGAIRDRWAGQGWERGFLGYPVTGELPTPDGAGRFNHFQGGSVYWSPGTGAHEVHGAIRARWAALGWELGALGYPTSDEYGVAGGRRSDFQHGSVTWTATNGQLTVAGN